MDMTAHLSVFLLFCQPGHARRGDLTEWRLFGLTDPACTECCARDIIHVAVHALDTVGGLSRPLPSFLCSGSPRSPWFGLVCRLVCGTWCRITHRVSSGKVPFPIPCAMEVLLVFVHGASINDLFDCTCATAPRILACVSALSLMWMTFLVDLLGNRVADDTAVAREGGKERVRRRRGEDGGGEKGGRTRNFPSTHLRCPQRRSRRGGASNVCTPCTVCQCSCPWG